ncbi:MAG: hypothetical protein HY279_13355 [Nitrospinae bacterium]|nr:hypothetical protein [Nitrospinota bacterium]
MKRFLLKILIGNAVIGLLVAFIGCGSKVDLPKEPPDDVVKKFYSLLSQKGKGSSSAAYNMISTKYKNINEDAFRRWTEQYDPDTKIRIIESSISNKKDKRGDIVARVKIEFSTPSIFGGSFTSTSHTNLILDEKEKTWKIDFTAETIDEEAFKKQG